MKMPVVKNGYATTVKMDLLNAVSATIMVRFTTVRQAKNTTTKFMSSSVNVKIVADFITRNVYKSTKPTSWSVITFQPAIPHQRMRQQEGKRSERETIVPLSFPDMNVQLICVLLVGNEKRFGLCIWGVPRNDCILVSIVPLVTILIVLRHFAR